MDVAASCGLLPGRRALTGSVGGGGGGLIDVSEAPLLRISQGLCSAVGFQSAEQRGRAHGASVINTSPAGLARR